MKDSYGAIALCALGLEKVLANEIGKIGLEATGRSPGRVRFEADAVGLFRANLELRTAERILLEAARFRAVDFDALFEGARSPAWEKFFARDDKLVIERVRSRDSQLSAQTSVQSIVHKAIYETLGRKYRIERMPETGRERSLRVYIEDDECVLGLDLSGEALNRRGYRRAGGEAPLKETIAAGVLLLAGWRRRLPLLDPFCGAGTLLIEAALFALDRAPGLDRSFDMETMPMAREGASADIAGERERARAAVQKKVDIRLVGSDADPRAIDMARANAERAGVAPLLDLRVGKAEDARPDEESGILLTNPPWGERLGTEAEAEALYERLGEAWGASSLAAERPFTGWGMGFVTNRPDFGRFFGRRAPVEKQILNGAEEQWFHWFPAGWEERPERSPASQKRAYAPHGQGAGRTAAPPRDPRPKTGSAPRRFPNRVSRSVPAQESPAARETGSRREGYQAGHRGPGSESRSTNSASRGSAHGNTRSEAPRSQGSRGRDPRYANDRDRVPGSRESAGRSDRKTFPREGDSRSRGPVPRGAEGQKRKDDDRRPNSKPSERPESPSSHRAESRTPPSTSNRSKGRKGPDSRKGWPGHPK
jgi:putative N6-adenine-specific DNA methylase